MGVIRSLPRGIDAVKRNPVIAGLVFLYSLLAAGINGLQFIHPLLVYPAMLVFYLVIPFFVGGLVAMVDEALDGRTSVDRFLRAGTDNYLSILGGGLLLFAVTFVLYLVVLFVGFFVVALALGVGGGLMDPTGGVATGSLVVLALFGVIALLIVYLPLFVVQFFPAAIVVDDLGLIDSLKRAAALVKDNFLAVIGFDALSFLIGLLAYAPTVYLLTVALDDPAAFEAGSSLFAVLSTTQLAIYLGATVVLGTLVGTVIHAFYVAFYAQLPRGESA